MSGLSLENYNSAAEAEQDRQEQIRCVDYALVQLYLIESKYGTFMCSNIMMTIVQVN